MVEAELEVALDSAGETADAIESDPAPLSFFESAFELTKGLLGGR